MNDQSKPPFLPFCRPSIGQEEIDEVVDTLTSDWLTTGPKTKRFEQAFADYVGARHAIAVNSCTAGLHLALVAAGIGDGDEVITASLTFCATANVIVHQRARPVLVDIDEESFTIDPDAVLAHVTSRTKAIIPVDFGGHPCELARLKEIASSHNLLVIEDAAHATGACYRGQRVGSISAVTAFSFYATKNMTTAEGGMITTDDAALAERMRVLALHGISADAWKRYSAEGSWYYEVLYPGYKYNMTDVQASLGLRQLAKLPSFLARRAEIVTEYTAALGGLPEIRVPSARSGVAHAWHLYPIRIRPERLTIGRNEFIRELTARGIGTSVHFIPVHLHPFYRDKYGFQRGDLPRTEAVFDTILSLPLFPSMRPGDVARVIRAVTDVVGEHRS